MFVGVFVEVFVLVVNGVGVGVGVPVGTGVNVRAGLGVVEGMAVGVPVGAWAGEAHDARRSADRMVRDRQVRWFLRLANMRRTSPRVCASRVQTRG